MTTPTQDEPICEECNTAMHEFSSEGISGWACADCGWSFDTGTKLQEPTMTTQDEIDRQAFIDYCDANGITESASTLVYEGYKLGLKHQREASANELAECQAREAKVLPDFITQKHCDDLIRVNECFDDGQEYDLPKTDMVNLAKAGLVSHTSRGIYMITGLGYHILYAIQSTKE